MKGPRPPAGPVFHLVLLLTWVLALGAGGRAFAQTADDEVFLEDLSERTFRWFWDTTNTANGLAPDRGPPPSVSSIAAVGFALTAYPIGAERGYITRAQAAERVRTTLQFFQDAPQGPGVAGVAGYRGFFYHFLNLNTGLRDGSTELSTLDTAWLMIGVLFCQSYFDGPGNDEAQIRSLADAIYRRVEWDWMVVRPPLLSMAWDPTSYFTRFTDYKGYCEAMALYLLALGSPTHAISDQAWGAFTSTDRWADFYGQEHVNFGPLFGHQFSHAWIDFRGLQDAYMRAKGLDYFENSRRATYAQRAYAIANPSGWKDYGPDVWGLTACDGPADVLLFVNGQTRQFHTYNARGASSDYLVDDGTIAPAAAAASIPFAPEIAIPAVRAMRDRYGDAIFNAHGFVDAFNPTFTFTNVTLGLGRIVPGIGWVDNQHLGIDQGPLLLMIENYRSGLVWAVMQRNPYLVRGLQRAGFTGGWLTSPANITHQPSNAAADVGGPFSLTIRATGLGPLSYQWYKEDVAISGAVASTYAVAAATANDSGTYRVRVSNPNGSLDSAAAVVQVHPDAARLISLATRGFVGTGDQVLISGCVSVGAGTKRVLLRAVGPTLAGFGLEPDGLLADPRLSMRNADGVEIAANDNWGTQADPAAVQAAFAATGAFPLPAGSTDAALLHDAPVNQPFTTIVSGAQGGTGVAIVEIYALEDAGDARLVSLATRGFVGPGSTVMIQGFYLGTGGTRRLLVRAVGPTLQRMAPNLQLVLANPALIVRRAGDGAEVARNNDWTDNGAAADIGAVAARVGAFALDAGSHDAALILVVPPAVPGGNDRGFTAQVYDEAGHVGLALVEVYEIPTL